MNHSNLITRTWTKNKTKTLAFPVFFRGGSSAHKRIKIILTLLCYNYKSVYRILDPIATYSMGLTPVGAWAG
jgi:hypothetical protein